MLNECKSWLALKEHKTEIEELNLKAAFSLDKRRFDRFSLYECGILLDYSKNRINSTTIKLLIDMADELKLDDKIKAMFHGQKINTTEQCEALHTALRFGSKQPTILDGQNVTLEVRQTLNKMAQFCQDIHSGNCTGFSGRKFTDILCLGIGGSFLGPKVVVESLRQYRNKNLNLHFVANIDGYHLFDVLNRLNADSTLIVIASKSFSTAETMLNAKTVRQWLLSEGVDETQINRHFVAVTHNVASAEAFGVDIDSIFPMWDWVGGRYSLWSAIGLPIALAVGFEQFEQLLQGACEMDRHFSSSPFEQNMPVILALLGIWNTNFWGSTSHCIIPYCHYLRGLPAHIQQLDMESNGKSVDINGEAVDYLTGPAIWGSEGVNSQHAFFQHFHQGKSICPVDFIIPLKVNHPYNLHHDMLVANCFAQSQALMQGKTQNEAYQELLDAGMDEKKARKLAPHKKMDGNKPNNVLVLDDLSPKSIGALLALYEHKVVVQGMLWNINSFDQWGVELGKQLSKPIIKDFSEGVVDSISDSSTRTLMAKYLAATHPQNKSN